MTAEDLAHRSLDAIARDGAPDLARDGDTEPRRRVSAAGLDEACVARIASAPFFLSFNGSAP